MKYPCSRKACSVFLPFVPSGPNVALSASQLKESLSSSSQLSFSHLNHYSAFSLFFPHIWELSNLRDSSCMHPKIWDSTSTTEINKFFKSLFLLHFGLGEGKLVLRTSESRRWGKCTENNEVNASKIKPWHPCGNWCESGKLRVLGTMAPPKTLQLAMWPSVCNYVYFNPLAKHYFQLMGMDQWKITIKSFLFPLSGPQNFPV